MDQQAERRELYNGFGNGMSMAVEFVVSPVIFAGIGWLLDRWLGLSPVLTVILAVVGAVAVFVRTWYRYDFQMREQEAKAPWASRGPGTTP